MKHLKRKKSERMLAHIISAPFIYILIFPMVSFDIFLEIYHRVCFKLYKIKYIKRTKYIKIDRHKLKYLTPVQKFNCTYCGYATGLMNYSTQIVAETENYWCGIQHQKDKNFTPPEHHENFTKYDDK